MGWSEFVDALRDLPVFAQAVPWGRAALVVLLGWLAARTASVGAERLARPRTTAQYAMLTRRFVYYAGLLLTLATALGQLGFDLSVLLGAAGVATVAIGFASQTSASNVISGLFLVGEQPFVVGDYIRVGTTSGEVLSIDLLSIRLRTRDNLMVRVPNETLLKTEITNLTAFPIRRYDLLVGVAYKEDLDKVKRVLLEVADQEPLCLDEPKPEVIFQGFADSSVNLQFSVWTRREGYLDFRTRMAFAVKRAFDEAAIEIPFPHRTLYTGAVTAPMPVQILGKDT